MNIYIYTYIWSYTLINSYIYTYIYIYMVHGYEHQRSYLPGPKYPKGYDACWKVQSFSVLLLHDFPHVDPSQYVSVHLIWIVTDNINDSLSCITRWAIIWVALVKHKVTIECLDSLVGGVLQWGTTSHPKATKTQNHFNIPHPFVLNLGFQS